MHSHYLGSHTGHLSFFFMPQVKTSPYCSVFLDFWSWCCIKHCNIWCEFSWSLHEGFWIKGFNFTWLVTVRSNSTFTLYKFAGKFRSWCKIGENKRGIGVDYYLWLIRGWLCKMILQLDSNLSWYYIKHKYNNCC